VSGRYDEAVGVYRAWLEIDPDDAQMRQELGLTLLLRGRFDEAVDELERASRARPDDVQAKQDLGYALVRAGKPKRAERVLQAVLDEDPSRREAVVFLARAKALLGLAPEAIGLLDSVIAPRQASEQALRMRAHLRLVTGDARGALDDYGWVLEAKPDDPAALLGAAGALVALGRLDDASGAVDKVAAKVKSHPIIAFRRAQIAWRRGDAGALDRLATFARANPTSVEAWREVRAAAKQAGKRKLEKEARRALEDLGDLE
jgi:tetratricopeptide (TPR) repeat protein